MSSSVLKSQLKALLAAKEYRAAIVLLESSSLPDKQVYIQRIEARIAAEAESPDDALKRLIASGDYGQARSLLQTMQHPNKAAMLSELDRRIAGEKSPAPEKPDVPVHRKTGVGTGRRVLNLLAAAIITTVVIGAILLRNTIRNNDMYASVHSVCSDVYRDDYYNDTFTWNQLFYGCLTVAQETIDRYGQEVNYCYDNENQTDARFMQCLADNDVKMYSTALFNTPKE